MPREQVMSILPLNPPAAQRPPVTAIIAYCVIVPALIWTGWLNYPSSSTQISALMSGNAPDAFPFINSTIKSATKNGNAVALFRGIPTDQHWGVLFINKFYFRANYTAYPRRLFVCDDAEIFKAKQLIAHPFAPTKSWLGQHNVHCILIFDFTPAAQGRFNFKMENIGP